ncbi:MAG: histidine kinase dimerization/phospho-acceptor domain-containing protein, partial [Terriglobales bacterium]
MKLSLAHKELLLVVLPLCAQILMLCGFAYLEYESEAVARKGQRSQMVSEAFDRAVKGYLDLSENIQFTPDHPVDAAYWRAKKEFLSALHDLQTLYRDDPRQRAIFDDVSAQVGDIVSIVEMRGAEHPLEMDENVLKSAKQRYKQIKANIGKYVSDYLMPIQAEQKKEAQDSPRLQSEARSNIRKLLWLAIVVNVLLALAVAAIFNRDVLRRLSAIRDNSMRLAGGMALEPALEGTDEIAQLDATFHDMAYALSEQKRKEKLILENARDLICTVDDKFVFNSANEASEVLLGYTPSDLIGTKVTNLVAHDSSAETLDCIKLAMTDALQAPFEARLRRKDGKMIDVLWSAQWSQKERSLFCVLHDISERKAADRLRQEVTHMVSHDLRTPLSSIRLALELLESGRVGELSERAKQLVRTADISSQRMMILISDLLDIEKMESGMLELNKEKI